MASTSTRLGSYFDSYSQSINHFCSFAFIRKITRQVERAHSQRIMDNILAELESMAGAQVTQPEDLDLTIARWQALFEYSYDDAETAILQQRTDLTAVISEDLWEEFKERSDAQGHDRESYSHYLRNQTRTQKNPPSQTAKATGTAVDEYLVRLGGPISSADAIRDLASLSKTPKVSQAPSEDGRPSAQFCHIDGIAKNKIEEWLHITKSSFDPLFIPFPWAAKNFDSISAAPTLGLDTTMPQNKPHVITKPPRPLQDEYPVWYFFYGTLSDTNKLQQLFRELDGEDTSYVLHSARVYGGKLTTWADKYKALVDDTGIYPAEPVSGDAFLVISKEHEDALRAYETRAYEVVRCRISFEDATMGSVDGCTFRICGKQ